jgi:hypothetical protein
MNEPCDYTMTHPRYVDSCEIGGDLEQFGMALYKRSIGKREMLMEFVLALGLENQ